MCGSVRDGEVDAFTLCVCVCGTRDWPISRGFAADNEAPLELMEAKPI